VFGRQYEIERERTETIESVWRLIFQHGKWAVERSWKTFDPATGASVVTGTERHTIEAFEVSPTGRRLARKLRRALDKAVQDA